MNTITNMISRYKEDGDLEKSIYIISKSYRVIFDSIDFEIYHEIKCGAEDMNDYICALVNYATRKSTSRTFAISPYASDFERWIKTDALDVIDLLLNNTIQTSTEIVARITEYLVTTHNNHQVITDIYDISTSIC